VLFSDLVDATRLSASLDPEEWRDVAAAYLRTTAESVERFGGYVAKYLGDGVLAYFGWPTAHEDDAERAARAGLSIVEAVGRQPAPRCKLEAMASSPSLRVRVGIDTGSVVIGDDGEVYGEPPNVAARVQAAAEPDTVLVTGAVHRLCAGLFLVENAGARELKGVARAVSLYRIVRPTGVRGRLAAAAATAQALTPFVRREAERETLYSRFEQAREGEGQVVLLVGEAGIGKSRLAQVLREDLGATPHSWLESGGAPYFANTPFYAVSELLRQSLAWSSGLTADARVDALAGSLEALGLKPREAVPLVAPMLDLQVPDSYPPVAATPEVARKRLLATLVRAVLGTSRLQPTVILLEDLHWVDPSTLELQQMLVEQGAAVPLLLVYTARPEFRVPWPLRAHHTQLTLNRLSRRSTREMVVKVAAPTVLAGDVVEAVVSRTDGVPLFVEELTKAALEAGARGVQAIPATLADSLMARLDRLGAAKEVAQVGGVLGREFSWLLLHAVQPVVETELEAALRKLADAELLSARGLVPEATYTFKHALVQDTAYGSLLKSRRRELHARVARVLAERFPETAERQPEVLAHHHTEAGDTEVAVEWWERAGRRAFGRGAMGETAGYLRRGLAVLEFLAATPLRDERERELQLLLGTALVVAKGYASPEVATAFARARALSKRMAEPAGLLLLLGLWASSVTREGPAAARRYADEVLAAAESAGLSAFDVWAYMAQATTRFYAGDFRGAREQALRALDLYDEATAIVAPIDPRVATLAFAGWATWHLGHADEARALIRAGAEQADRNVRAADRAWAHDQAAVLYYLIRKPQLVLAHAEAALAACTEETNPLHEANATLLRAAALTELGEVDGTVTVMQDAVKRVVATGQRLNLERYHGWIADVLARTNRIAEALAALEDGEGAVPGEEVDRADTLRRRAELLGRQHAEPAAIETVFREALAVARRQGSKAYELRAATSLARWLGDQGRAEEGCTLLRPIHAAFTEGFDTPDLIDAKTLLEALV
jgi:class 3 adenylate cyclase